MSEHLDLTVAERQFLSFALDLASDRMASRGDEFTDEDHAALDRFRRMSVEEASAPGPVTLRLNLGSAAEQTIRDVIRKAVRSGPLAGAPLTDEQRARAEAYLPEGSRPTAKALRAVMPRRFALLRHHDVSGVSGTGLVADGVLWPDGTASVRWRGEHPSVVFWDRGQLSVEHIHGHQGATEIVWIDEP